MAYAGQLKWTWAGFMRAWLFSLARAQDFSGLDDAALVAHFRDEASSRDAVFEVLMQRHQNWLLRMLTCVLANQGDAEDVTQEVMVRAYKTMARSLHDGNLRPWLRVMALRMAFNWKRDQKTRHRYEEASWEGPGSAAPRGVNALEASDVFVHTLGKLAYPYREILSLRYIEDLDLQDISDTLDLGLSATKMRLKRAREMFKDSYHREVPQ